MNTPRTHSIPVSPALVLTLAASLGACTDTERVLEDLEAQGFAPEEAQAFAAELELQPELEEDLLVPEGEGGVERGSKRRASVSTGSIQGTGKDVSPPCSQGSGSSTFSGGTACLPSSAIPNLNIADITGSNSDSCRTHEGRWVRVFDTDGAGTLAEREGFLACVSAKDIKDFGNYTKSNWSTVGRGVAPLPKGIRLNNRAMDRAISNMGAEITFNDRLGIQGALDRFCDGISPYFDATGTAENLNVMPAGVASESHYFSDMNFQMAEDGATASAQDGGWQRVVLFDVEFDCDYAQNVVWGFN